MKIGIIGTGAFGGTIAKKMINSGHQVKVSNRDSFEDLHTQLLVDKLSDAEDKDEYLAENVFYVPPSARWNFLQHQRAKLPSIGKDIDDAMDAIEKDNPTLKGVLPKDYARPALDKKRLGELVDLIGNVGFKQEGHSSKDLLGRVYEYFLGMFADAEGKRGGRTRLSCTGRATSTRGTRARLDPCGCS